MDRFTVAVVGGVVGLVLAGLVAAIVLRGHAPQPDLNTPSGVVLAYAGGIFGPSSYTNRTTVRLTREASGWRITVPPDPYVLSETRPPPP
ncbi:MAG: hypothetical protein LC797_21705 [Chloroflexi bacterium]|nr:hypothetical protein [Chloroflexota bacterium]